MGERPMTSTQRLMALGQQIADNKKFHRESQKSKMTKFNAQLDDLTNSIVRYFRTALKTQVLYIEADFVIDAYGKIWLTESEQCVVACPLTEKEKQKRIKEEKKRKRKE